MRIDRLQLLNFRCFEDNSFDWHPRLNLIAGKNATGKTALLEGLSVALGAWLVGVPGYDARPLRPADVRLTYQEAPTEAFIERYPVDVSATGIVAGVEMNWSRSLQGRGGRTTTRQSGELVGLARGLVSQLGGQDRPTLPVISYYGTSRLHVEPKQTAKLTGAGPQLGRSKERINPLTAYLHSVDPRISTQGLVDWLAWQAWTAYTRGLPAPHDEAVRSAMAQALDGARRVYFDPGRAQVIVEFSDGDRRPFEYLSDGQRTLLSLIGDIACRAVRLNGHLGDEAVRSTPGIVLIDELELHLHPTWQRSIARTLTSTFPQVQFFCSTHSPQVIGEVGRECVWLLDEKGGVRHPHATMGVDSNELLGVLDGSPRSVSAHALEGKFYDALLDLEVETAEALLEDLRRQVEAPSCSVTRWETLLGNARATLLEEELR